MSQLIISILSSSAIIGAIIKIVGIVLKRINTNRNKQYWQDSAQIHELLTELAKEVGADRALLLRTENGGGVPRVGKDIYSSVCYESYDWPDTKPMKRNWQKQLIDKQYSDLILQMMNQPMVEIHTSELPDGCLLKDVYVSNKIQKACVKYILHNNKHVYYLSISWDHDYKIEAPCREQIRIASNTIKSFL